MSGEPPVWQSCHESRANPLHQPVLTGLGLCPQTTEVGDGDRGVIWSRSADLLKFLHF